MSTAKLKNAPLKEVIFELHWECSADSTGIRTDTGFDLAQGKFAEQLKEDFNLHRRLIPDAAPFKVFGAPVHQYWRGELKWPVIQHGQGMIAINQTEEDYEWEKNYKPLVVDTIRKLINSYEDPPKFNNVKLQYLDAWALGAFNPVEFMSHNLQTVILTKYELPGPLANISIQQRFVLPDKSIMSLNISDGINTKDLERALLWTTTVEKKSIMNYDEIVAWLEIAHSATSNFFKKMLNPDFYASLDR